MKKLLLSFLLITTPSYATDLKHVLIPSLYYSALQYGDWKSSKDAVKRGGKEENFTVSTIGLTPAKIIGVVALTTADVVLQKDKKALWVYRISIGGIYGAVIIHNARVGR